MLILVPPRGRVVFVDFCKRMNCGFVGDKDKDMIDLFPVLHVINAKNARVMISLQMMTWALMRRIIRDVSGATRSSDFIGRGSLSFPLDPV